VARELEGRGYAIVERNFRKQFGELDLVALRGHRLVFVEVRSQTGTYLASPLDSIDHRKREKLKKIAGFYLEAHLDLGEEVTFAVAAVRFDAAGRPVMTEFFEDAF
jgi:putative endonuclease